MCKYSIESGFPDVIVQEAFCKNAFNEATLYNFIEESKEKERKTA